MAKRVRKNSQLIFEGKRIFPDKSYYDDNEILGCSRLVYAIYNGTEKISDNSILISCLEELINKQEERHIQFIKLRFWQNWNLKDIAKELGLSIEGARLNEEKIIRIFRNSTNKFCVDEQIAILEYELTRLNSIKNGDCVNYDIPLSKLGLSVRAIKCLGREGITTVRGILTYSEEDFRRLRGLGKKTAVEIIQKTKALFPAWDPSKRVVSNNSTKQNFVEGDDNNLRRKVLMLPIEKIQLATRAYNTLKHMGIDNVEQFLNTPEEAYINADKMGDKTLQVIRDKRTEILTFLSYDT